LSLLKSTTRGLAASLASAQESRFPQRQNCPSRPCCSFFFPLVFSINLLLLSLWADSIVADAWEAFTVDGKGPFDEEVAASRAASFQHFPKYHFSAFLISNEFQNIE
jgi:hypothetical protein